ncbi:hypothetical protein DM02DRAFT_506826, partial [Periconia macrospinosa]
DFEKSQYVGAPSNFIDASWHHLLENATIRVTAEELHSTNQKSIELPQGGYMAWFSVFHELHCILVRQWIYRDHYHPNMSDSEMEERSIHTSHCLDVIRSAVMCHADSTLVTFRWANASKPMLDPNRPGHRCVDWDVL